MTRSMRYILRRFGRLVAFLGVVAWVVGSWWTWSAGNAEIFQRFGALGVAAAVLFFSDHLTRIELARQRSVERLLHEFGVELTAMRQGVNPTEMPKEGYAVDFLTEERNFDGLRQKADLVNFLNVMLMTVATLQWGFGDRVVNKLVVCGLAQC